MQGTGTEKETTSKPVAGSRSAPPLRLSVTNDPPGHREAANVLGAWATITFYRDGQQVEELKGIWKGSEQRAFRQSVSANPQVELDLEAEGLAWPDNEWLGLFCAYRDFPADLEEQPVAVLEDVRLVDRGDLLAAVLAGVLGAHVHLEVEAHCSHPGAILRYVSRGWQEGQDELQATGDAAFGDRTRTWY